MTLDMPALVAFAREQLPAALFVTVIGPHRYGFTSEDRYICLRGCHQLPLPLLVGLQPPSETQ